MAINDWAEDQRPRERSIRQGAVALSDAELLAVFLRVGVKGKSAVDLGRDMLHELVRYAPVWREPERLLTNPRLRHSQVRSTTKRYWNWPRRSISEELQTQSSLSSPQAVKQFLQFATRAQILQNALACSSSM